MTRRPRAAASRRSTLGSRSRCGADLVFGLMLSLDMAGSVCMFVPPRMKAGILPQLSVCAGRVLLLRARSGGRMDGGLQEP